MGTYNFVVEQYANPIYGARNRYFYFAKKGDALRKVRYLRERMLIAGLRFGPYEEVIMMCLHCGTVIARTEYSYSRGIYGNEWNRDGIRYAHKELGIHVCPEPKYYSSEEMEYDSYVNECPGDVAARDSL